MKNEEQFFKGIEDTLYAHEDAYVPGAWEEFQQKRKRRGMGVWFLRVGSAAAVLLLLSYVAFLFVSKAPDNVEYAGNKPAMQQPKVNQPSVVPQQPVQQPESNLTSSSSPVQASQLQQPQIALKGALQLKKQPTTVINSITPAGTGIAIAKQNPASTQKQPVTIPVIVKPDTTLIAANNQPNNNNNNNIPVQPPAVKSDGPVTTPEKVIAGNNVSRPKATTRSLYDSLLNSKSGSAVAANTAIDKAKERKINYDVIMQPAVGNQKFNIGGGVQVSYKLSNRLSVNSGIAYASLNATAATSAASARSAGAQNVSLAVSGVEVPVGIKYHANNGYYVSAGVMGMSVINNHMEYNYVSQGGDVQATFADKESLAYSAVKSTPENKTAESKEKVANYLGFYILSAGKKIDIGKKKNINIGPFLRVPFGPVSSEKVRLMQGGVTLGFGF